MGFSGSLKKFEDLDTVVLGISADTLATQKKFIDKEKLEMPLLADPETSVIKAFNSLRPTGGLANRDTIVIDKKGTIRKIYRGVKNPADHAEDVFKYIKDNLASK